MGDYALALAHRLREDYGRETVFLAAAPSGEAIGNGFKVCCPLRALGNIEAIKEGPLILHYVNYAYDPHGVPLWLPKVLRQLKGSAGLLTIFHELYATGSFWQLAFWLQPLQKKVARLIADLSKISLVSSELLRDQLQRLAPGAPVVIQPVMSNFGEPKLSAAEIENRNCHDWVICGGSALVERSVRSFLKMIDRIPGENEPKKLYVLGGCDNLALRRILSGERRFKSHYHPDISAKAASQILSTCAFGWIDYFVHPGVSLELLQKSGAFAAMCAHAVVPVTPNSEGRIDGFPGPFFVGQTEQQLPSNSKRAEVANCVFNWYQEHASSVRLATKIDQAITALEH